MKHGFNSDRLLRAILAYILSFFLLKYGIDKLMLQQFYTPKPNTLFTPIGQLSKDILFWTSMGTSSIYNWFMAALEIIPGLLLLHSKTREFAAIIAFGVLLNVFMINVGFDISVKLFSFYLLLSSIYLLQPSVAKLFQLFILKKSVQLKINPSLLTTYPIAKRTIKSTVICLFILEISLPYLNQPTKQNEFIGAYELERPSSVFNQRIKRIFIHSEDYLILENTDNQFTDYKISITGNYIHLMNKKTGFNINQKDESTEFRVIGNPTIKPIITKRIDLSKLPLLQDDFHWTVEGMIGK